MLRGVWGGPRPGGGHGGDATAGREVQRQQLVKEEATRAKRDLSQPKDAVLRTISCAGVPEALLDLVKTWGRARLGPAADIEHTLGASTALKHRESTRTMDGGRQTEARLLPQEGQSHTRSPAQDPLPEVCYRGPKNFRQQTGFDTHG